MTPALKALCELREGFEAEATYIHQRSKSQGHILMSELQAILAAIADLTSGKWAVVPVEPTEEMLEAADEPFHAEWKKSRESSIRMYGKEGHASEPFSKAIYRAMIQAKEE